MMRLKKCFRLSALSLEKEAVICSRIVNLIKLNLDIEADSLNQLFLLLDIKNQNQKIQGLSAAGIILSHGYATASSIADAANQIIGRKVFDAIDMPLDMQMSDITGLLEKHIERFITCQDVILLVDMGSLEQIHSQMRGLRNLNIGIINNISTALAVDIGLRHLWEPEAGGHPETGQRKQCLYLSHHPQCTEGRRRDLQRRKRH